MPNRQNKYNIILDALQKLLEDKDLKTISVSDIAQAAGIGKGSIYYYFPSKEAILEALVERNYEKPLTTARNLSSQTNIPLFTRMAMIFQACRSSSYPRQRPGAENIGAAESALLHQKYINHLISEFSPVLAEIIQQGIDAGEIHFEQKPQILAEIVLIVLTVKFDNTLVPSSKDEIEETIAGLVSLVEKGTDNPPGSLNFLLEHT